MGESKQSKNSDSHFHKSQFFIRVLSYSTSLTSLLSLSSFDFTGTEFSTKMSHIKADFGLEDKMGHGLRRQVDDLQPVHPIELSERNFAKNQEKAWLKELQKMQGISAPLKIMHEKRAVANVGHIPCMSTRSNFQMDILEGNDDIITFNDFLGRPELHEGMAQPHDVIDKHVKVKK